MHPRTSLERSNDHHGVSTCEQESSRFQSWRQSPSVPVRSRRGVAAEAAVQVELAVEQVERAARAAQPEPQAAQAVR